MRKISLIICLLIGIVWQMQAQKGRMVSGTVLDADGNPMIGVTVIVKGTTIGTVTDIDGKYAIRVPDDKSELQFSSMGYLVQMVDVTNGGVITVTLEEDTVGLDEVVVTALGISRQEKSLGYAVTTIGGSEMDKAREPNLINSLSGRVAGVQINNSSGGVGSSSRIQIRGAHSLTGNSEPLIVVDGFPIDNRNLGTAGSGDGYDLPNGMADINPDNIEEMTTLKGSNATAVYGLRGANGVILIKTKRGSSNNKGVGVSFNSSTTFETPLVLPDFQNSYGQGPSPDYFEFVDGSTDPAGVDESWGPPLDKGLEFTQWNSPIVNGVRQPLPWVSRPDNVRNFFDLGLTNTNNVRFASGSEKLNYALSLSNFKQKGMVPNTEMRRYDIMASADAKLTRRITANFMGNYIKSLSDNLPFTGYTAENPVQQMIWSGRNVDFEALRDYENLPLAPAGTAAEGTPANWNTVFQNNPYWVLDNNLNTLDKDRLIGNFGLSFALTDYLALAGKIGTDTWTSLNTQRKAHGSNQYPFGYYSETHRNTAETNSELTLKYAKDISQDFDFSIILGGNAQRLYYRRIFGEVQQLELPGNYNLSNVKSGTNVTLTNRLDRSRINSVFGMAQLGFRKAIYLDITGRNDWASVLPLENNSFFYPSVSLSAVITELLDLNSNTLSYLKARVSWAATGSKGVLNPYDTQQTFSFRDDKWGVVPLAYNPDRLNNPNIKPESTHSLEGGIDARLFEKRVRLDLAGYNTVHTDLIVPVEVSAASGYTSAFQNVGEMSNKGIELVLGFTPVQTKNLKFDVDFNFAKNKNKVVSLGGLESLILGGQWNMTLEARVGEPFGSIVGPAFDRAPDGQIIHMNGLPQIAASTVVLGNIQPDFTGGVNFGLTWKQINVSTLFDYRKGSDLHSMTTSWGRYSGVLQETLLGREDGIVGEGVMNVGSETEPNYVSNNVVVNAELYNKTAYGNQVVDGAVFDASFVKWRSLVLGYQLPDRLFKRGYIQGAGISLIGRNLAILHRNAPHIDPETAFSSESGEQGQEFGQVPSARSIGFNVNLRF